MLEAPDLKEGAIVACLREAYGLPIISAAFLPLGADQDSAIYRADATDGEAYFVKLRRGELFEPVVTVPHWLHAQGIRQIIAPRAARDGALWTRLEPWTAVLYPFVAGQDAVEAPLSDAQLLAFGSALRKIHDADPPSALQRGLSQETYDPYWRNRVRMFQALTAEREFTDPVAAETAALFRDRRAEIDLCVARAEALASVAARQSTELRLCHGDLHAWNILVNGADAFYIVDWDNLILAPRERDLMFIGAWRGMWDTEHEAASFYAGYGETPVDEAMLAYYRYERVVQDIEAYCESLLLTDEGGADREVMFGQLASNFGPGGVVDYGRGTGL